MTYRNRLLISSFAAWIIAATVCLADQSWRFVVVGDSRGGTATGVNEKALSELVRDILPRDIDFVIFPGDLVYGAGMGLESFERQLWNWIAVMRPLYDAGIPVYACRGNHEIADMWYPLPGELPDPVDNCAKRWLKVFGNEDYPLYRLPDNGPQDEKYMSYSVVHKNALIVGLDQYAGVQYRPAHAIDQEWLNSQLESNVKPHVFVFGHEEAFRTLHPDCLDAHPGQRDAFWNSLKAAEARAYFCCHDHFYDHAWIDDGDGDPDNDIHQFIVATGGAPFYAWTPPYDGNNGDFTVMQVRHVEDRYGYLLVNVDDTEVTMAWLERQDANSIVPASYEARDFWRYKVSPNVVVLRPRPGERIAAGRPYTIQWKIIEGAKPTKQVRIEYSLDAGRHWTTAGETDNAGTYVWSTPTVSSAACLIRITGVGNPKMDDTTDGTFSIATCPAQPAADLNGDCRVDFADLAILAGQWLTTSSAPALSPNVTK